MLKKEATIAICGLLLLAFQTEALWDVGIAGLDIDWIYTGHRIIELHNGLGWKRP